MRVRLDIGLDLDGIHTFHWEPAGESGVEVPKTTLDRWTAEREAFRVAYLRWKRVSEEIEDVLFKTEASRVEPAVVLANVMAEKKAAR
jgi:hypothetical protein